MATSPIPNNRNLARLRYEQTRQDVQSSDQDRVRGAREALARLSEVRAQRLRRTRTATGEAVTEAVRRTAAENASADSVEISDRGRQIAAGINEAPREDEARAERIAQLKASYQAGELNSPERVERAAENLLRRADGDEA